MPALRIRTDKVAPTQLDYDEGQIRKIAAQRPGDIDTDPIAHLHQGLYHVSDGHHRVAAAMVRGDRTVRVRRAPPDQADVVDPRAEHLGARCYIDEFRQRATPPGPEPIAPHQTPAQRHAESWRQLRDPFHMLDGVVGPLEWWRYASGS
jgi:hypothetical protein